MAEEHYNIINPFPELLRTTNQINELRRGTTSDRIVELGTTAPTPVIAEAILSPNAGPAELRKIFRHPKFPMENSALYELITETYVQKRIGEKN